MDARLLELLQGRGVDPQLREQQVADDHPDSIAAAGPPPDPGGELPARGLADHDVDLGVDIRQEPFDELTPEEARGTGDEIRGHGIPLVRCRRILARSRPYGTLPAGMRFT